MPMKTSDMADISIMPFVLMLWKGKWGPEP